MSLARFTARILSRKEIDSLIESTLLATTKLSGLEEIILFGSALTQQMNEGSDLDFVYIFDDEASARAAQKQIHGLKPHPFPCDFICVDRKRFNERSDLGGILFVARTEGKTVYRKTNGTVQEKI